MTKPTDESTTYNKPTVQRISKEALQKVLSGQVMQESTCFIKFYSNTCPMCHELRQHFVEAAYEVQGLLKEQKRDDVHFFAFNIADYQEVEKVLDFEGVPTIVMVRSRSRKPKIVVLPDPENAHPQTWYHPSDIKSFFKKEI